MFTYVGWIKGMDENDNYRSLVMGATRILKSKGYNMTKVSRPYYVAMLFHLTSIICG